MKITRNTAVTISLKVSDEKGLLIDEGKKPFSYLHGGYDSIFPKLEEALEGQEPGFATSLALSVEDAFGAYDEALVQTMPKSEFPAGVKVGGQIQRLDHAGEARYFFVTKIKGPVVMLDGNHPLAGKALRCAVKVLDVREASAEEIAHEHVHGEHGHQH
ncbi:peptidylprolyl isomerase [Uliginosibacterium sp. 31-16]|uniref:FKBP-type peptidyl-prolyl cis-trans isomerase n=1 Tax=Uliginosibacterium sp. 31-16 TaxID=3068315 RepID=UPI00273D5F6A|nr:peptidylprolyl isomerase [Uliginosibacterium sp. 31-16]MDP5239670.1 peptidylprolyl isomerase [Uliginosibacterium sp. 31-16]